LTKDITLKAFQYPAHLLSNFMISYHFMFECNEINFYCSKHNIINIK
jgi:hypothetical protein